MEKANNILLENSEDPKKLCWKSINIILHRFPAPSLPERLSLKTIFEIFSYFFEVPDHNELQNVHPSLDIIFLINTLSMATETEIKKLIMKSKSTSSDLDPLPTSLLKNCFDVLIEPITSIIKKSLQEGFFRTSSKKRILDLC